MQSFIGGSIRLGQRHGFYSWSGAHFKANRAYLATNNSSSLIHGSNNSINSSRNHLLQSLGTRLGSQTKELMLPGCSGGCSMPGLSQLAAMMSTCSSRSMTTAASPTPDSSQSVTDVPPRIKFKRLDKTAKHILQILDKEAVEEVKAQREIPDIKPGNIVQLRVEVPENKRRVSTIKGIVIARRNAGLNTTFRLRRMVAGVGVESLFPLYYLTYCNHHD
ncbi:Ribosomal protein L19 family protein isoform 3 [Theobroma cacao]|uniref:Ribosomal protein L19 family protein isoform 3 n=1 Tax=Theobroma cacao TaxID=3641 RepID=A0A061FZG5_THECC|nr:Ribosomal protein L19 family protein isoform 3 [Theobroma cacao]